MSKEACDVEPMGEREMLVIVVGKFSHLGKRKEKNIMKQKRKWAEAFKDQLYFLL